MSKQLYCVSALENWEFYLWIQEHHCVCQNPINRSYRAAQGFRIYMVTHFPDLTHFTPITFFFFSNAFYLLMLCQLVWNTLGLFTMLDTLAIRYRLFAWHRCVYLGNIIVVMMKKNKRHFVLFHSLQELQHGRVLAWNFVLFRNKRNCPQPNLKKQGGPLYVTCVCMCVTEDFFLQSVFCFCFQGFLLSAFLGFSVFMIIRQRHWAP